MNRNELRKMLPHGAMKEVAKLASVSQNAVAKYFKGEFNSYKIEVAALEIANKYEGYKKELTAKLNM